MKEEESADGSGLRLWLFIMLEGISTKCMSSRHKRTL